MFRPTHFVILFAVFLCASAFPAAPEGPAASEGPEKAPPAGPASEGGPDKGDLETDATSHWGYAYYGPRWGYYNPGFVKTYGWGFGRAYGWGPYGWF